MRFGFLRLYSIIIYYIIYIYYILNEIYIVLLLASAPVTCQRPHHPVPTPALPDQSLMSSSTCSSYRSVSSSSLSAFAAFIADGRESLSWVQMARRKTG